MLQRVILLCLVLGIAVTDAAGQQQVPVEFSINNAASEVAIDLSIPGSSDSDASPVSGSLLATLDVDTTGGTPNITGIEFTGGDFTNDEPFDFSLTVLFLTANLQGTELVGSPSTPAPPSVVTQDAADGTMFQYDAADHLLTIHDGLITVTGAINESLDLSQEPVSGMAPAGSFATIELTPSGMVGTMTEFSATLTQPTLFSDTFDIDAVITTLPVTVDVSGQVIATASFALELGGGGLGPGDYNGGGVVEQADLDLVLLNWGIELADPASVGWINNLPNGVVDQEELDGVLLNWGAGSAPAAAAAGVPEPATLLLLLPVAGWAVWHLRRAARLLRGSSRRSFVSQRRRRTILLAVLRAGLYFAPRPVAWEVARRIAANARVAQPRLRQRAGLDANLTPPAHHFRRIWDPRDMNLNLDVREQAHAVAGKDA